MAEYNEEENKETSQYNEGLLQIQRLHDLWLRIEISYQKRNLVEVEYLLDAIFRELFADIMKMSDPKKVLEDDKKLKKDITQSKTNRDNYYNALNIRHQHLKLLQDQCGKGSNYRSTDYENF